MGYNGLRAKDIHGNEQKLDLFFEHDFVMPIPILNSSDLGFRCFFPNRVR